MPQAGLHAIVGAASRKWAPKREWLLPAVILGSLFPDLDNLVVAYATLAKLPDPEHYHRSFTHSVFTILGILFVFYAIAMLTGKAQWRNFGVGFGAGILMHIALDLMFWFGGVELLWPIPFELNFWAWFETPAWLKVLLETGEFLAFGAYFLLLGSLATRHNTDAGRRRSSKTWAYIEFGLFVLFTALFFTAGRQGLQYQVYGGLYLLSLIAAFVITVRMKQTIETP